MKQEIRVKKNLLFVLLLAGFLVQAQDTLIIKSKVSDAFGFESMQTRICNIEYKKNKYLIVNEKFSIYHDDSLVRLTSLFNDSSTQVLRKSFRKTKHSSEIQLIPTGIYEFNQDSLFIIKRAGSCVFDGSSYLNEFCGILRCFQYFKIDSTQFGDTLLVSKKWFSEDNTLFHEEVFQIVHNNLTNIELYDQGGYRLSNNSNISYFYKQGRLRSVYLDFNYKNVVKPTTIKIYQKEKKVLLKVKTRNSRKRIKLKVLESSKDIDLSDLVFQMNNFFVLPSIPFEEQLYFWLGTRDL